MSWKVSQADGILKDCIEKLRKEKLNEDNLILLCEDIEYARRLIKSSTEENYSYGI